MLDDAANQSTPPQTLKDTDKEHGGSSPQPALDFKEKEKPVAVNFIITVTFQEHSPGNHRINIDCEKPSAKNEQHTEQN